MELKEYARRRIKAYKPGELKKTWKHEILLKHLKNGKLLDIGCASGYLSKILKDKKNYFGLDYNPDLVDFCVKNGMNVKHCDISKDKIPFDDNTFDVAYCSHILEHITGREQFHAMKEICRVLKPGGILIAFAPTPYHWYFWDDHTHVRPCTHGQLEHLAKDAGFSKAEAKYSKLRFFSHGMQKWLRLPPIRFFLWEVFLVAKK